MKNRAIEQHESATSLVLCMEALAQAAPHTQHGCIRSYSFLVLVAFCSGLVVLCVEAGWHSPVVILLRS